MKKLNALTVREAADYLHFAKNYIYRLIYLGKIRAFKPSGGKLYFLKKDLDDFVFSKTAGKGRKNKTTVG